MKLQKLTVVVGVCVCVAVLSQVQAGEMEVGGYTFRFEAPLAAKETPRPMTKGGVTIPVAETEVVLDANFYYFGPGQGGGVEANVARWIGQFEGKPEIEKEESAHGDRKLVILRVRGTYLDGSPFGEKTAREGYALLGAILEGGDAPVFIKLVGAEKDVTAVAAAFKVLAASPFAKE